MDKKKITVKQYFKNLGKSSTDIIRDAIENNDLYFLGSRIKEDLEEAKRAHDENRESNILKRAKKKFWQWIDSDRFEEGSYKDDIKKIIERIKKGVTTGKWGNAHDDLFDLLEDEPEYLFSDDDSFPVGESYNKSFRKENYMSITQLRDKYLKSLRFKARGESLLELSPIEPLNDKVEELSLSVERNAKTTDDLAGNEVYLDNHNKEYNNIKDQILGVLNTVSENPNIEGNYKEVLSDMLATLFMDHCKFHISRDFSDEALDNVKQLENDKLSLMAEVNGTGSKYTSEVLEDKLDEIDPVIEKEIEDKTYKPLNEPIMDNTGSIKHEGLHPFASGEDFLGIGDIISSIVVPVVAIPYNLINKMYIEGLESKYGSNFVFKQPMIISSNISNDVASKFSKAIEVKQLIELKGLIEATVARQDGGSVVSRAAKGSKILSPLNIELRDASSSMMNKQDITYDEIISAFSESGRLFFRKNNSTFKPVSESINSLVYIYNRNPLKVNTILNLDSMIGSGEAGDFIDLKRNALPTYMEVNIDYEFGENPLDLKRKKQTRKTTVGLQIMPRKIDGSDICNSLNEINYKFFDRVNVTKEERNFIKKVKNMINFWKKDAKGDEMKALKSNAFSDIANKILNVKSPLFHIVLSYSDYMDLKNNGTDLMNKADYERIVSRLPIISITIIDEDSDILYLSDSLKMNYLRHSLDDFVDTVSQYEKDLKTIIKYNQM